MKHKLFASFPLLSEGRGRHFQIVKIRSMKLDGEPVRSPLGNPTPSLAMRDA
jgi:hypothetical protein